MKGERGNGNDERLWVWKADIASLLSVRVPLGSSPVFISDRLPSSQLPNFD
jgi:hypothetical protein